MTTQTLRKDDDGHAKHNKQTTTAERTAIRTAPELKDNDSRSAFIRHEPTRKFKLAHCPLLIFRQPPNLRSNSYS